MCLHVILVILIVKIDLWDSGSKGIQAITHKNQSLEGKRLVGEPIDWRQVLGLRSKRLLGFDQIVCSLFLFCKN